MNIIKTHKDLEVYRISFDAAMEIFVTSIKKHTRNWLQKWIGYT